MTNLITKPHTRPHLRQRILSNLSVAGVDLTKLRFYSGFDIDGKLQNFTGGNDGIITGASFTGKGRYGPGLFFDGIDDRVNISKTGFTETSADQKELSVFVWSKIVNNQNDKCWASRSETIGDLGWQILVSGGANATNRIQLSETGAALDKDYTSSFVLSDTADIDAAPFHHTGFTFNGALKSIHTPANDGRLILYCNGIADTSPTVGNDAALSTINLPDVDVLIGDFFLAGGTGVGDIKAVMDSVLIYAGVIDPVTIKNLFNAGL